MSKAPRVIGKKNKPAKAKRPRKHGIPRYEAYQSGIAAAAYDLEHLVLAYGAHNVLAMVNAVESGHVKAVHRLIRKWNEMKFGDKYSMIDEHCGTTAKYGLSAACAHVNGAGLDIE